MTAAADDTLERSGIIGAPEVGPAFTTEETRASYLNSLPHEGYTSRQHEMAVRQISMLGVPVDNIRSLHHRENERGRENLLGTWHNHEGQYSTYDRLDQEDAPGRLGTLFHEAAHANSPLHAENARLFGGEANRALHEQFVRDLATQTVVTERYLNGYHKMLAEQLYAGEIDADRFAEETGAIVAELRITNPRHLETIQAAQHAALARRRANGDEVPANVNIVTGFAQKPTGIDAMLLDLMPQLRGNLHQLDLHALDLKRRFYGDHALAMAYAREAKYRKDQRRQIAYLFSQITSTVVAV